MSEQTHEQSHVAAGNTPPEQSAVSELALHGDPSMAGKTATPTAEAPAAGAARAGGVQWVRPSDLLAQVGMGLGARAVHRQEQVVRRMRVMAATPVSRRGIAKASTVSLPPVSVFGQNPPAGATREAVGK